MAPDLDIDVNSIVRRQFATVRRGYDQDEVRAYLRELADVIDGLRRREAEQRARAEAAEARTPSWEDIDEHRLVEMLGEETARILDAGRVASADIRRKAEEAAERLIAEANEEAHRIRAENEAALLRRRAEVNVELEALRAEAAAELDRRRAEGAELVNEIRRTAQAEADELVDEAQVVRRRLLGDLARRRRQAREQLERLNAARERLLAAYDVVRRTVDEATSELTVALPEAKLAGESASRRVHEEPEPTVEDLEDMVT
ncbi:MAG TPA: DivIVA domain-containing protein, partial [Acidimicrobiales bacterium]